MSIASNRIKLLAILALFVLPLALAALMFSGKLPVYTGETVNQGKLVIPPVALTWPATSLPGENQAGDDLLGSWVILLPVPETCDPECMNKVIGIRQVHRASGREQHRIRLVLLTERPLVEESKQLYLGLYDRLILLPDPDQDLLHSLQGVVEQHQLKADTMISYLVDPLGNIMMAYDMPDSETRMSKDLKRLLTWSKQDKG